MSAWRRIAPKTRLDWIIVSTAGLVVTGLIVWLTYLAVIYDGPRRIDMKISNDTSLPMIIFVDGYYSSTVNPYQTEDDLNSICHALCKVEITDTDGHVLCTVDLGHDRDEGIHRINIVEELDADSGFLLTCSEFHA